MQLETIKKRFPDADSVGGKVIIYFEGKHYDLGVYAGEGQVVLSADGRRLMEDAEPAKEPAKPPVSKKGSQGLVLDNVKL